MKEFNLTLGLGEASIKFENLQHDRLVLDDENERLISERETDQGLRRLSIPYELINKVSAEIEEVED